MESTGQIPVAFKGGNGRFAAPVQEAMGLAIEGPAIVPVPSAFFGFCFIVMFGRSDLSHGIWPLPGPKRL